MSIRYRQTIPIVDPQHPDSWGRDDRTGLPAMRSDLIEQKEWIGGQLAWTGFMVHWKDADLPNPQLAPPRLKIDPVPVSNPRYFSMPQLPTVPTGLTLTASTSTSISVSWTLVAGVPAYTVNWQSEYVNDQTTNITTDNYTITDLSPGNTYTVAVASIGDNSTSATIEFSTSAFSTPLIITTPLT